ncbi:hypothetical protein EYF80_028584 [Liparis tanakae]|uniref:Uncharacterized protein n=1 Tax=Liparis tanakae TaxID=230148 RepID=A0A4Z2H5X2_9TELE|nr:hypothetical protein EYF80_028584 [Liparis tanakae]
MRLQAAVQHGKWELTVSGAASGMPIGACRSPGDFTQGADPWETIGGKMHFEHTHVGIQTHKNAQSVGIAFVEAVGMSEGLQRRHRGQDVTQTHSLPQQPQLDQGARPPQHLHGALLAAALQARPVHLGRGGDETMRQWGVAEESREETQGLATQLIGRWIYPSGSSARKNGFDHDTCAPTSYDAKTKTFPVVNQLYHLHITPLTWQRL